MSLRGDHAVAFHRRRPIAGWRLARFLLSFLLAGLGIAGINGVGYQGPFSPRIAQRSTPQTTATQTVTITPSGIHAGGQHNIVKQDPDNPDTFYAASDVGSVEKSTDGCKSWFPCSAGIIGRTGVAALEFNPSNHDEWWCLTGKADAAGKTATGAMYRSTDRCVTWTKCAGAIAGCGNGSFSDSGSGTTHIRSVGRLIIFVGSTVYVGAFGNDAKGGLRKTSDNGATWSTHGSLPANSYIQGLALDTDGTTLIVGLIDTAPVYATNGIYKVTTPGGTTTKLAGSGTAFTAIHSCEEIWVCATHVRIYAICNTAGLFYSNDHGANWSAGASLPGSPQWASIDGIHSTNDTLYVGCVGASSVGTGGFGSVYTFANPTTGSGTSLVLASASNVSDTMIVPAGVTPLDWWMKTAAPNNRFGRSAFNVNRIVVDTTTTSRIVFAGTAGCWITTDTGATFAPCVYHMIGTANRFLAVNPTNNAQLLIFGDDYNLGYSLDSLTTFDQQSPNGAGTIGGITFDDAGRAYVSIGKAGPICQILSSSDPTNHAGWTDESVGAGFAASSITVRSFGVFRDGSGVLLIDVLDPTDGVYRRATGTWSHPVAGPPFSAIPLGSVLSAPPVQCPNVRQVIFRLDPNVGLYKSVDYGASEFLFWTPPGVPVAGVHRLHMDSGGHLYVHIGNKAYRIDGAQTTDASKTVDGGQLVAVPILNSVDALGMSPSGVLMAATTPQNGIGGTLVRSRDLGTTWANVGGASYPAISPNIECVAYTDAGKAYLGTNGMGCYVVTGV